MYEYTDFTYQEIEKTNDPSIKEKYWKTGFGLNQIDGLTPSDYLMQKLLPDNLARKLSYEEVEEDITGNKVAEMVTEIILMFVSIFLKF